MDIHELIGAAYCSDLLRARQLLADGADPNAHHGFSKGPLHLAAEAQSSELVELLLFAVADPTRKDVYGLTPLDYSDVAAS